MKNKKSIPLHPLVTRRDFLAQGLIGFAAVSALPTFLQSSPAWAGDCGAVTGTGLTPFMVFDMAGGASLPGNFLVGKTGGPMDLLQKYSLLGWDPRESAALNTEFGLPMSAKYSKMLSGILANTSTDARKNLRMGSFCHIGQDDSRGNKLSAATLVLKAGNRGTYITNGLGMTDTLSGGNSAAVQETAAFKPTFVKSVTDVLGATSFGGPAFNDAGIDRMIALAQGGVELSNAQKTAFSGAQGGSVLAELSKCAYGKSVDFVAGVKGLDPRLDTVAQTAFKINQGSNPNDVNAVVAALAMNTIRGSSGPSAWALGGCDYHDGTASTGDGKDEEMGVQIGRAVEFAHLTKKPFFFQLITDGGNSSRNGSRSWASDSGDKSMTVIGYYDPAGPPKYYKDRMQIGNYTDGQGAEVKTLIGGEPALVAYAVFANYLNLIGKLGEFSTYAPGIFTGTGQLDSVLIFEGKAS